MVAEGRSLDLHHTDMLAGRSLNSSRSAFEELYSRRHFQIHSPYQPLGVLPAPPPPPPRRRPLPGSEMTNFTAIQPKPPGLNTAPYVNPQGESMFQFRSPGDSEPPKKKRGRPSNAQIEVEKATAAAQGIEWKPRPTRQPRKKRPTAEADRSPAADAPPPAAATESPDVPMTGDDDDSSGAIKRRRKNKEEHTVVRQPYDPVRQSPTEAIHTPRADMSPPNQPPVGQASYHFQASDPDSGNASSTPKDA